MLFQRGSTPSAQPAASFEFGSEPMKMGLFSGIARAVQNLPPCLARTPLPPSSRPLPRKSCADGPMLCAVPARVRDRISRSTKSAERRSRTRPDCARPRAQQLPNDSASDLSAAINLPTLLRPRTGAARMIETARSRRGFLRSADASSDASSARTVQFEHADEASALLGGGFAALAPIHPRMSRIETRCPVFGGGGAKKRAFSA